MTYFFLFLDMDEGGSWGRMAQASLRGRPRGRLSGWAGLSVDTAPPLLEGGEGPWSEGSTVLSSDDILKHKGGVTFTKASSFDFCFHFVVPQKTIKYIDILMWDISVKF